MSDNNQYDNTLVLFKNEKYEQGGKHPMYKGNATFQGTKLNCSVWLKEANGEGKLEKGTKFFSGTFDGSYQNNKGSGKADEAPWSGDQSKGDDDIPF
jgi:hypothetical protein